MSTVLSYLYIAYFYLSSAVFVWISITICLLTAPFDPNRKLVHKFSCWWGHHYIAINPFWHCTFDGLENVPTEGTFVYVSNHQSYWDIMVLYGIHRHFKWVSKESIFKIPFIGWNMSLNQYIKIARGDLKSIKEMMATCRNWLNQGSSIMIFPEGTRSETGEILEFRDGPFKMACDCKVPVVPIVITGTKNVLPKGSSILNFTEKISVRVLAPVKPEQFGNKARPMREQVRKDMIEALAELRGAQSIFPMPAEPTSNDPVQLAQAPLPEFVPPEKANP